MKIQKQVGSSKDYQRKEGRKVLLNSCIRKLDRIGVRDIRKPCAVRLQEEGRLAVNKINRAFSVRMVIEDSKRCNIPMLRERLKTVSLKKGVDKTNSF